MWLKSYLTDRYQFVQCGSAKSEPRLLKLGVPQGSILGPLLFLIHIDDLTRTIKDCKIQIYADDTAISFSHENANIIEETLTNEMTNIVEWLVTNRLVVNLRKGKTEAMLFGTGRRLHSQGDLKVSIRERFINFLNGYKYLGVTLSMNDHLQKTLRSVTTCIRLRKGVRHSLSDLAAE